MVWSSCRVPLAAAPQTQRGSTSARHLCWPHAHHTAVCMVTTPHRDGSSHGSPSNIIKGTLQVATRDVHFYSVATQRDAAPRTPDWSWILVDRRNLQCTTPQHHITHTRFTQTTYARGTQCQWCLRGQVSYLQCTVRYTPHCPVGQHSQSDPRDTGLGHHSHRRNHWGKPPCPPGCLRLVQ